MRPTSTLWDVVSQPFKRSQTGLFQGRMKQYGNNVPFSKHKTRRTWLPNVQHKRLHSDILERNVGVKLTVRALRTIKKKGGLDNYLKTTSPELLGDEGMRMRITALTAERRKNGLDVPTYTLQSRGEYNATHPTPPQFSNEIAKLREEARNHLGLSGPASIEETLAYVGQRGNPTSTS